MAFLTINGITANVTDRSAQEPKKIGDTSRAMDGTLRKVIQATKNEWDLSISVQTRALAEAWRYLIDGYGYHWSFTTDFYSDGSGLGYSAKTDTTAANAGGKFNKKMTVGAATGTITWAALPSTGAYWTVMVWRYESAAWHHYTVTGAGTKWVDGVSNDGASTTWLSVSAGSVTIANATGSAVDYSDLVVLPYRVTAAWYAIWGVASAAFSDLPKLSIAGDMVTSAPNGDNDTTTAMGEVEKMPYSPVAISGSWNDNAQIVSFKLRQV